MKIKKPHPRPVITPAIRLAAYYLCDGWPDCKTCICAGKCSTPDGKVYARAILFGAGVKVKS